MKTVCAVIVAFLCLALVGCSSSPALSMNKRMAYANSGATLTSAVALDQVSQDKFDEVKAETIKVCEQVKKFLDDGLIADLPVDIAKQKIEEYMIKQGWQAYIGLVDVAFAWIEVQQVPVQKLGADNIVVIKTGLDGVIAQTLRAKKEWAKPFGTANVDTTKGKSLKLGK